MDTTNKLLDAAEYRMRRGGYNAVSFRDLAGDMDIKSSSVHYHFPRKEDLGVALVERYSERFFAALAKASKKATTPTQKLQAFRSVYRMALNKDDAVCLCGLLGAEMAGLPDALTTGVQSFFKANVEWIVQALPDDLSKSEKYKRANTIVATHQGAMMMATSLRDKKLFDSVTEHLIDMTVVQD
jgi:TetR/AcrR family transcriptional repressor of nem operon